MTIHPLRVLFAMTVLALPVSAEDAKPAPAAVRAKAVVIKKAVPVPEAKADGKVEVKAEVIERAARLVDAKPAEKPAAAKADSVNADAAKVAPANLKGFGKNEDQRKPAAAAAVAAPLAVPANAGLNDAQLKQMKEQYKQQLRPVLLSELAFIRLTCDIPQEKRKAVLAAGRAVVDEAAQKIAEQQNRNRNNVRVAVQANTLVNDPPKAIRAALDAALKDALSEEQLKVYREEAAHRKEQIKQAAIHSAVARLDGMLCLTPESREKITTTIGENWQESYERWLQIHQYGDQYFPSIPDQLVSVHLNPEQRQIWTGLQKIGIGGWGGGNVIIGGAANDDGWWGEAVIEAGAGGMIEGGAIFIEGAIGF